MKKHLPYLLVLWILPALVYLKTLQPSLYFIDAGTTLGGAYTLGIPTPPGYPSYMVIAHLFTKIPWGTPLFRIQLFSILSALMALTMVYFFIQKAWRSKGAGFLQPGGENEIATSKTPRNDNAIRIASLVASLALAFSYQFWSQTLNIQSYVFTDFLMLATLFLVFYVKPGKRLLTLGAIAALFITIASGGSAVMIVTTAAAFLIVLVSYWDEIGAGKLGLFLLLGLLGVAIVYSYLPIRAHARPFLNWGNPQTVELFWNHVHSAGTTFNDPITGKVVGYNLSPIEFAKAGRKYFELLFWQFTPFLLPIIGIGGFLMYQKNKKLFWILASVPIANLVYGGLVISGNRESWFILSYVVSSIFLGLGVLWILQRLPRPSGSRNDMGRWGTLLLLATVLAPLVWWYPKLSVRSNSHALTDYANNLYAPIEKDKDAVLFGIYDTFHGAIMDRREVRGDRKDVFPVMVNELYVLPWYREHMRILRPDLVPTEIDAMTTFGRESEYNEMMNFYIEWLLKKGHPVYVSRTVFTKSVLIGTNGGVFSPDPQRLKAVPAGLVERIILVEAPKSGAPDEIATGSASPRNDASADAEMKLTDFNFTFLNPQEYETPPYFLEGGYKSSWNDLMSEYALSYIAAAEKLFEVKAPVGQNSLGGLGGGHLPGVPQGIAASPTAPRNDSGTTDREKAKEFLKKAERIAPNNLEVMNRLAIVYAGQGEFKKTLEYFKKASEMNKDNLDLKFNLAKSYLDTGDTANGKRLLQEILKKAPEQAQVAKAASSELSNLSLAVQAPTGWQTFTNEKMNLKFFYPEGFSATFSSESLIKLTNNGVKKDELTFLIYSKQLQPGEGIESISSSLPFVMDGVLLQSQPAGLPGYQSIMRMYGTGPDNIVLLLLKRDQQGFGVRIFPGDSNKGSEFQGILQSIKTLK